MRVFVRLVARDLARALVSGGTAMPVVFFLLVATLYPFAVGPDAVLLGKSGGGMLWVAALLAALLPVDRLVAPDAAAGVLDQLAVRSLAPPCCSGTPARGRLQRSSHVGLPPPVDPAPPTP